MPPLKYQGRIEISGRITDEDRWHLREIRVGVTNGDERSSRTSQLEKIELQKVGVAAQPSAELLIKRLFEMYNA